MHFKELNPIIYIWSLAIIFFAKRQDSACAEVTTIFSLLNAYTGTFKKVAIWTWFSIMSPGWLNHTASCLSLPQWRWRLIFSETYCHNKYTGTYIFVYTYTSFIIHIHIHTHTHIHMHIHMYIYIYTQMYTYIYIYIHRCIYVYCFLCDASKGRVFLLIIFLNAANKTPRWFRLVAKRLWVSVAVPGPLQEAQFWRATLIYLSSCTSRPLKSYAICF